ncbi:MAG: dephospho-CoA kinase [Gammaproteobacteria bacterium]
MLRVGLTGGIGSGKSTVAALFAALGAPVIDTDLIARELVEPGQPALAEILSRFGADLLDAAGRLDRARLGAHVFADAGRRQALEAILHPRIQAEAQRRLADLDAPYALLVVPLLFEAGWQGQIDRILVVDVPEPVQRTRVAARDGLAAAQIEAILAAQASRERRRAGADDLIDNSGDPAALAPQVAALHQHYLRLASLG